MVQVYSSSNMATARKNSYFILSTQSYLHIADNLSIVVHASLMHMLTSLSVDEILLPRYMNWTTNFRSLPFNEDKNIDKGDECILHFNPNSQRVDLSDFSSSQFDMESIYSGGACMKDQGKRIFFMEFLYLWCIWLINFNDMSNCLRLFQV